MSREGTVKRRRSVVAGVVLVAMLATSLMSSWGASGVAAAGEPLAEALVLVNSLSASYADYDHYIQPYLSNFGIPITVLDIATTAVTTDVADYAVIITGHRQLDVGGIYLDVTEQDSISGAVNAGTGLVNFDNDLWSAVDTPRYAFVDDVFDFGYAAPSSQSGVSFVSATGGTIKIDCTDNAHQDPDLATTTNPADLVSNDGLWTEYENAGRGYPAVFGGYAETLPRMHFFGAVPNGEYTLRAHLYWSHNLRYFWGTSPDAPQAYSLDVTSGESGEFSDYELGTVTVSGEQFDLYVENADPLTGGVDYPFFGWAWLDLTPTGAPPAPVHYITERHEAGSTVSTGSMAMAGIAVPATATALAMSGSEPFLVAAEVGAGRAVQWGSYAWMSHAVKGPVFGLDDLVWRSIVWAARKPFVMQGMPPFVTMRVDDEAGPFEWIHIANEFGIKPWSGLFYHNVDATEAADLSALVHAGQTTASVHAKTTSDFFYYNHGTGDWADAIVADNYAEANAWHTTHDIPISKFVLPHYYEFGTNVFQGLSDWGVEFVGTHMVPGNGYGASWLMDEPYRLYEAGSSGAAVPVYYADYLQVPDHPGFDGDFFNCVTEIRDDAGYEWYPNLNDVAGTIGRGTRQTVRALDSMALATLFTHGYYVGGSWGASAPENWRAILQGITDNIAAYNPIYVTMDHACQYVRAIYESDIISSVYDPAIRLLSTTLSGTTDMPTMFYLFSAQGDEIVQTLVDVPTSSTGTVTVNYTLAGPLTSIEVSPGPTTVVTGGTQQFTAVGYDADDNPIPNLPVTWSVVNGGGTITAGGLFTAGAVAGSYTDTVCATFESVQACVTVNVEGPALHHFTFDPIPNPQIMDAPFTITIRARDQGGALLPGYVGSATLSDSTGTIDPTTTGSFVAGVWTGQVTIAQLASGVTLTASDGAYTGTSNVFNVQAVPTFYTLTSPSYEQQACTVFPVTVQAYAGTTIDLSEDEHQDPDLVETSNANLLVELTPPGTWFEFLYTPSRDYPTILAHHLAFEQAGLPLMTFSATGIPNGTYEVFANLYDNSPMRYYYGWTSDEPTALHVDVPGGFGGTQHREYSLGTVTVTGNSLSLYVQDAELLPGGTTYPYFGWAWLRLVPVTPSVQFSCADDAHQEPDLVETTDYTTWLPDPLDPNAQHGQWVEFYYAARGYPTVLAHHLAYEQQNLPLMTYSAEGISNGTYEVFANLYDNAPMRYYYGWSSDDPLAEHVDVPGGSLGTQHREYSLGTVDITDGTFNLYVRDAQLLPGGDDYPYFGWAWIRLEGTYVTMTSSSPTMEFDANGDGTFGDTAVLLTSGSAIVQARDCTPGVDVTIEATDTTGRSGATLYDILKPTSVGIADLTARRGGSIATVLDAWAATLVQLWERMGQAVWPLFRSLR